MIHQSSKKILCVQVACGKTHDFALFKGSRLPLTTGIELLADTDYKRATKAWTSSMPSAKHRARKANSTRSPKNKNYKTNV